MNQHQALKLVLLHQLQILMNKQIVNFFFVKNIMTSILTKRYTSVKSDYPFLKKPNPTHVGPIISEVELEKVKTTYLEVDYFNGDPVVGGLVTVNAVQTLTNKSLVDNSTSIVSNVEPTGKIMFTSPTTANVTTMITSIATQNQNIIIPDEPNGEVMLTTGDQVITGLKQFQNLGTTNGTISYNILTLPTATIMGSGDIATIDIGTATQIRFELHTMLTGSGISGSNIYNIYVQRTPFIYGLTENYIGDPALSGTIVPSIVGNDLIINYSTTYPNNINITSVCKMTLL